MSRFSGPSRSISKMVSHQPGDEFSVSACGRPRRFARPRRCLRAFDLLVALALGLYRANSMGQVQCPGGFQSGKTVRRPARPGRRAVFPMFGNVRRPRESLCSSHRIVMVHVGIGSGPRCRRISGMIRPSRPDSFIQRSTWPGRSPPMIDSSTRPAGFPAVRETVFMMRAGCASGPSGRRDGISLPSRRQS